MEEEIEQGNYSDNAYTNFDDTIPSDTTNVEDINGGDGVVTEIENNNNNNGNNSNNDSGKGDSNRKNTNKKDKSSLISKLNSAIKTGDNNNVIMYIMAAVAAFGAIAVLYINRRKLQA